MKSLLLLLAVVGLAGCSTLDTHHDGDPTKLHHLYVEHLLTDNHRLDQLIVAELTALGYDAACGPLTMMPERTEAIITYRERSAWDFKNYLIELDIEVKGNFSGATLATGRFYQPSIRTKTPAEVVHTVITPIFRRK